MQARNRPPARCRASRRSRTPVAAAHRRAARQTPPWPVAASRQTRSNAPTSRIAAPVRSAAESRAPRPARRSTATATDRAPGAFRVNSHNRHSANTPAMVARATVRNTGSNSSTARRVAGSEPLKITTPIKPLIQPLVFSSAGVVRFEVRSIADSRSIVGCIASHARAENQHNQKIVMDTSDMPRSRYKTLVDAFAADIRSGRLPPGTRLPTHRQLAAQEGLALVTASRVYAELEAMGLVSGETGRGTFVRETVVVAGAGHRSDRRGGRHDRPQFQLPVVARSGGSVAHRVAPTGVVRRSGSAAALSAPRRARRTSGPRSRGIC